MKNLAGLFVIAAAVLLIVVGARGTQAAVFPGLFPTAGGSSSSSDGQNGGDVQGPPGQGGPCGYPPDPSKYRLGSADPQYLAALAAWSACMAAHSGTLVPPAI